MTTPSAANLPPQAHISHSQEVSYGGRPATLYEQPESSVSLDVTPSDPEFLVQALDCDGQPHNFYGVPGLGIIDTTRSRAEGQLHWAAIFNPNNPDPDTQMYGIPIAGPKPDSSSSQWRPYDSHNGGLSQAEIGYPDLTGYAVKRVVVDGSTISGGDVSGRPLRSTTDPFKQVRGALNHIPGAADALDRWERIRSIYPDMRQVGQTALIKMVAQRKGLDEQEVGHRIRTTGFY